MYIYFVEEIGRKAIKIGRSEDPFRRLGGLGTANPRPLRLLFLIQCLNTAQAVSLEQKLHKVYAEYNIRGEWFRRSPELVSLISKHLASQSG
jgi:hypothetical protein